MTTIEAVAKANASLTTVRIALGAVIYYAPETCGTEGFRAALLAFVDEFIRSFGDDFGSFRISGTNHEWTGKTAKRELSTLRRKLTRKGAYRDFAFMFARGDTYAEPVVPMEFGVFGNPSASLVSAVCGFVLPVKTALARSADVDRLFRTTCAALQADQGYAGLTVTDRASYYFDGSAEYDEERIREVRALLEAHPTLDFHKSDVTQVPWLARSDEARRWEAELSGAATFEPKERVWGLRWPAWLNFVGARWVESLGGADTLLGSLRGLYAEKLDSGLLVRAGPEPPFGDGTYLEKLAAITAQRRIAPDPLQRPDRIMRPVLSSDSMRRWIRRFDPV
jgi:hypothetical protein